MSSLLDVAGENNSRSDFVVNAYGAFITTDRPINLDGRKTRVATSTRYKNNETKQVARILTSSPLDVTGENYSRFDFAFNAYTWIYYSPID